MYLKLWKESNLIKKGPTLHQPLTPCEKTTTTSSVSEFSSKNPKISFSTKCFNTHSNKMLSHKEINPLQFTFWFLSICMFQLIELKGNWPKSTAFTLERKKTPPQTNPALPAQTSHSPLPSWLTEAHIATTDLICQKTNNHKEIFHFAFC